MLKSLLALILTFSLLCTPGCADFRPGWVSENSFIVSSDYEEGEEDEESEEALEITDDDFDGPLGGHFNEEGEWVPDDPTIEWTYRIPDISGGFVFDLHSNDLTPSLQVEVLEFDLPLPYLRTWKFDLGVAYQRGYGYLGPRITSIFETTVGGFYGWNWEDNTYSCGIAIGIIKF